MSFICTSWFLFLSVSVSAQLDCRNIHILAAGQSISFLDLPQPSFDQQYLIVCIKSTATPHIRISSNNFANVNYFEIVFDYRATHDIETRQHLANNAGYNVISNTASIDITSSTFSDFWIDWDPNTIIRLGTGSIIGSNIVTSFPYTDVYPNKEPFQNIAVLAYEYAAEYQFWKQCTSNPTTNPSTQPTVHPTINPSTQPTVNPTSYPTKSPTDNPTIFPTFYPTSMTEDPTIYPTTNPTKYPSIYPTTYPTVTPTFAEGGVNNPELQTTQEGNEENGGNSELKDDENKQLFGMNSMIMYAIFGAIGCVLLMLLVGIFGYKSHRKHMNARMNERMKSTSTVTNTDHENNENGNEATVTQMYVLETPMGATSSAGSNFLGTEFTTQTEVNEVVDRNDTDLDDTDSGENDDLFDTVTTAGQ